MAPKSQNIGLLRVVPGPQLEAQIAEQDKASYDARMAAERSAAVAETNLAGFIRNEWSRFRRHRYRRDSEPRSPASRFQSLSFRIRVFGGKIKHWDRT